MIIGTKEIDERIYINSLATDEMTDEELRAEIEAIEAEEGEIKMPKLTPSKFNQFDFYINGQPHPRFDEIWEYAKTSRGETAEEIMAKFE